MFRFHPENLSMELRIAADSHEIEEGEWKKHQVEHREWNVECVYIIEPSMINDGINNKNSIQTLSLQLNIAHTWSDYFLYINK